MDTGSAIYSALGQDTRLAIVAELAAAGDRGLAAGELSARLSVKPPLLTAHLTVLREAGIVDHEKAGKFVVYRLERSVIRAASDHLCQLLGEAPNGSGKSQGI